MQLVLTDEQEHLGSTVRAFLQSASPLSDVRAIVESGGHLDRGVWTRLATELDVLGLTVPEAFGGAGAGQIERYARRRNVRHGGLQEGRGEQMRLIVDLEH